jgi:HEPN domain-containing protein
LLQESAERLLKAYLISHGWKLVKTHDLNRLVAEACDYDTRFRDFARMAEELTQQFWEQHYPGGDLTDIGEHYKTLRSQVEAMRSLVEETVRVSPKSPIPEG